MYISKNIDYFALCFNFISFFFKHLNSFVWNKWWGSRDAWIKHIDALPGLSFARLLKFELWKDICIKKLLIWLTSIFLAFRFIGLFPLSVLSLILLFLLLFFDDVKHFLVFLCIIIQLIVDGEYFTILLNVMHYLSLIHIWILRFIVYYSSFSLFHLLFQILTSLLKRWHYPTFSSLCHIRRRKNGIIVACLFTPVPWRSILNRCR